MNPFVTPSREEQAEREIAAAIEFMQSLKRSRDNGQMPREFCKRHPSLQYRFFGFIDICPDTGCWLWAGTISKGSIGYGTISVEGETTYVHHLSFNWFKGPIPTGLQLRHSCDTPRCCNPNHLEVGTAAQNTQDMLERGRHRSRMHPLMALLCVNHDAPADELAAELDISTHAVEKIRCGKSWSELTGIRPRARIVEEAAL